MNNRQHIHITIEGAVQGVGFRPFVYRLAQELNLVGWVNNSSQGVTIEAEGSPDGLQIFVRRIQTEKPPLAIINSLNTTFSAPDGFTTFEIRHSDQSGDKTTLVLPDVATCPDCLHEIFDPSDRRYRYPFTNCTNCGPRYSIIQSLPYDRPNTTMQRFEMCAACQNEYENPLDRRFHAQPNACPDCGPHLELWDRAGETLATHDDALLQAADAIRAGQIVAVKGLGGFHLMVDARNDAAVKRLRQRKHREEKPFALMCPSLASIQAICHVSEAEARLLQSPESPIVLLRRKPLRAESPGANSDGKARSKRANQPKAINNSPLLGDFQQFVAGWLLASGVAPDNPYLGVMLPYTPLHHLLMAELGFPVVATSGNLSDEPICIDEHEALERLADITDIFLIHNRPIVRHVDDSIVRIVAGQPQIARRARGYAPLPIRLKDRLPDIIATGPHLKNTIASSVGQQVFISQHIGDLETVQAFEAFQQVLTSFSDLYELHPQAIACDLHPDYLSTKHAERMAAERDIPLIRVQHHVAHVLACMAEHGLDAPVLGISWDGTGYGTDGTIWGGEFLLVDDTSFTRSAHLKTFRLPGGDQAVKEPRRTAVGLLYEIFGDALFDMDNLAPVQAFSAQERRILVSMLSKGLNAPVTSSAGRLFDAVASLVGLRQTVSFEGQAAMQAEFALYGVDTKAYYPFEIADTVVDWSVMVKGILDDLTHDISTEKILAKFHNTLTEMIIAVAQQIGVESVVLTGGCFQNIYLTERTIQRLNHAGFRPYTHQRVPPNDGGVALGQIMAAARELKSSGGLSGCPEQDI